MLIKPVYLVCATFVKTNLIARGEEQEQRAVSGSESKNNKGNRMTRGGKRKPGPGKKIGRPVLTDKRIKTSITLRPDHKEWLEGKNISGEIETALDGHIEKED
jgi:hypothetical protein